MIGKMYGGMEGKVGSLTFVLSTMIGMFVVMHPIPVGTVVKSLKNLVNYLLNSKSFCRLKRNTISDI